MRSIWKGHIRFSLVTIPIQIFNAVETKHGIKFNQLHDEDHGRVGYDKVCRTCNKKVPYGNIVKGYEYEPDQYVVFTKDELASVKLKSTRAIDIEAFIDLDDIHPSRFEAVYYIGPNGDVAKKTFSLFTSVLRSSKKAGVGRIILREKEDVVLLTAEKKGIVMYKLRFPYEVRSIDNVPDLDYEDDVDEKQMALAKTLVESLTTSFDKVDFENRYRDAMLDLVNSKIEGKEVITITDEGEEKPVVDIMEALKASIDAAKKKKTA